ncbi:MAG: hypothetical protein WD801_12140 [Gemmatimonadaceae bacterium]
MIGKYLEDYENNDHRAEDAFRRALALSPEMRRSRFEDLPVGYRMMIEALGNLDGDTSRVIAAMDEAMAVGANRDPEAVFLMGLTCAALQINERALQMIGSSVDDGFTPVHALQHAPVLAGLRDAGALTSVMERARQRQRIALAIFERGEGPVLLGVGLERAL